MLLQRVEKKDIEVKPGGEKRVRGLEQRRKKKKKGPNSRKGEREGEEHCSTVHSRAKREAGGGGMIGLEEDR